MMAIRKARYIAVGQRIARPCLCGVHFREVTAFDYAKKANGKRSKKRVRLELDREETIEVQRNKRFLIDEAQ